MMTWLVLWVPRAAEEETCAFSSAGGARALGEDIEAAETNAAVAEEEEEICGGGLRARSLGH